MRKHGFFYVMFMSLYVMLSLCYNPYQKRKEECGAVFLFKLKRKKGKHEIKSKRTVA